MFRSEILVTDVEVPYEYPLIIVEKHANGLKAKHPSISTHIVECIDSEWQNHVNELIVIAAGILSDSPNITTEALISLSLHHLVSPLS